MSLAASVGTRPPPAQLSGFVARFLAAETGQGGEQTATADEHDDSMTMHDLRVYPPMTGVTTEPRSSANAKRAAS